MILLQYQYQGKVPKATTTKCKHHYKSQNNKCKSSSCHKKISFLSLATISATFFILLLILVNSMLLAVPRTDACIILYSSSADSPQTNHPTSHDSYKKENNNSNSNVLHHSSFAVLNSIREWFVTSMDRIIMWNMNTTTDLGGNKQSTLSIVEISNMRVRDIKRRLAREHGYGADEISKMIDKKELINALSYEEHRVFQKELVKRKRVALRRSIMVALVCVILVMFRPLLFHAWEVLLVNVQVYTDKKRYEWSRIREYHSFRAAWGFFLILCINGLQLWLTVSVLVSWITPTDIKKKWLDYYLFPVPYIPIRPAALLATATTGAGNHYSSSSSSSAGGGPLAHYGINVGPMLISWLFQYVTGKVEMYMGRALSEAHRYQRKQEKRASKKRQGRKTTGSKKKSSQVTGTAGADAAASYDDTAVTDNNVHDTNTTSASFTTATTTKTTNTTTTAAASPQTREESPLNRTETATTNISKPNNSASESTTSFLDQHVYGAMDELD